MMEFPIIDLMSAEDCYEWLLRHFHPEGLKCPHCGAAFSESREFRVTKKSQVLDYRCHRCAKTYNVYSKTVFEGRWFTPEQAVLLVRGIVKGERAQVLSNEIGVCRQTVQAVRKLILANGIRAQPEEPIEDEATETDEMFQNAGEKRLLAW